MSDQPKFLTRRRVLQGLVSSLSLTIANTSYAQIDSLLTKHYGAAGITNGKVSIKLPALAENGNSVPIAVRYSGDERVDNLRIFAPENPEPLLTEIHFGQQQSLVEIKTRIRLANSQTVMAVVETRDGELFAGTAKTVITLAACVEPLL